MANSELEDKLTTRLQRQHERMSPEGRRISGEWAPKVVEVAPPGGPRTPDEALLLDRIHKVMEETREVQGRQRAAEAHAVARGLELGADVAKLRIDVEVLRRDLEATAHEVHRARGDCRSGQRKEEFLEAQALRVDAMLRAAEERRASLQGEVEQSTLERESLLERVKRLHEEVEEQVVGRVRLEALLRSSRARELHLRKKLAKVQADRGAHHHHHHKMVKTTSMVLDSDSCDDSTSGEDDLECSYEGLELTGVMPLDKAMALARSASSLNGGQPQLRREDSSEADLDLTQLAEEEEEAHAAALARECNRSLGFETNSSEEDIMDSAPDEEKYAGALAQLELALNRMLGGASLPDIDWEARYEAEYGKMCPLPS
mmetsp:Transcript_20244/g.44209  ORF Transcript_20244/g.44209 Transcript_20244/m.44209 type:complete len:374 (+) Transcript_20244:320-1441(+)